MKLSVVILNFKTYDKTIECISHIEKSKQKVKHVIIVDNDSQNGSLEIINDYLISKNCEPEIINDLNKFNKRKYLLYQSSINTGYARGNNIGIDLALRLSSDYILILNNDVKIYPDTISEITEFITKKRNIGCVGPLIKEGNSCDYNLARKRLRWYDHFLLSGITKKIFPFKVLRKHHYMAYNEIPALPFQVDMISGSFMLFPAGVLKKIKGFDPNTFLFYEEAIICDKIKKHSLKTYVVPSSVVEHEHAGTIKRVNPTQILKHSLNSQFYYLNKIRKYNSVVSHILMAGQYITYLSVLIFNQLRKK
jgi:GT2 family glycosyltransferase